MIPIRPATLCLAVLVACPAGAQGLTAGDCAEIRAAYGIVPEACREGAVAAAPERTMPTEDMRRDNVFFTQGGTELDEAALLQVVRLAEVLNTRPMRGTCLRLVGHSDSSGEALLNLEIGAKRAVAVQNRLALLLDRPGRIEATQSRGEEAPLPGLPAASPWQRRVEIWVRECARA